MQTLCRLFEPRWVFGRQLPSRVTRSAPMYKCGGLRFFIVSHLCYTAIRRYVYVRVETHALTFDSWCPVLFVVACACVFASIFESFQEGKWKICLSGKMVLLTARQQKHSQTCIRTALRDTLGGTLTSYALHRVLQKTNFSA